MGFDATIFQMGTATAAKFATHNEEPVISSDNVRWIW